MWTSRVLRRIAYVVGFVALAVYAGCEPQLSRSGNAVDVATVLASRDVTLAKVLASSHAFVEDGQGGVVANAWRATPKSRGMTFGGRLPALVSGTFDVGLATTDDLTRAARADFAIGLRHRGLRASALVNDDGHARYQDVAPATDLLVSATDASVEWLYLLRDASAPNGFAIDVELPKGLPRATMRRDGSLAFLDARGKSRLAIPAPYAIDARGTRREVALAWDASRARIELTLDTRELAYPVLVDPAVAYSVWDEVDPGDVGPTARASASIAYDSTRGVTVVFGGNALNDTWEWDGTSWAQRMPATSPPGRIGGSMVFDSARGRSVLFGGCTTDGYCFGTLGDTWEWDGTDWTRAPAASAPPVRTDAAMTYDSGRGRTVLFGGCPAIQGGLSCVNPLNDTWEWDGTTWTESVVASPPPARFGTALAYDSKRAKSVLFGGCTSSDIFCNAQLDDTWEWDGTTWSPITVAAPPSARSQIAMAYDVALDKTLLFGSCSAPIPGVNCQDPTNDSWEWDGTLWTQVASTTSPPSRGDAALAYDVRRGEVVLFGGAVAAYGTSLGDTWRWNGSWTQAGNGAGPSPRSLSSMVFDSARGELVLFGGANAANSFLNDTWKWIGTTWTLQSVTRSPPARSGAAMAYDVARRRTVLFGGCNVPAFPCYGDINDTWEWDGTSWTELMPSLSPSSRDAASMVYDAARAKTVLFGGEHASVGNLFNDTWEWDGSTWSQVSVATSPAARVGAAMTYDSARGVSVLFGGQGVYPENGDSPYLSDTWEWDGTAWTMRVVTYAPPPTAGIAAAYDSVHGISILFDGADTFSKYGQTWEWDGTTWRSPSLIAPPARSGGAMAFDPARGTVLFGGATASGVVNDTWIYFYVAESCTTSATCDSGACVDGVCCAQSQCGSCQSCAIPGSEGQCTNVAVGTAPSTGANACAAPNECTSTGLCTRPQGSECAANTDCFSGFCADGVCCDSACAGNCQACSTSRGLALNGTCSFAPAGVPGRVACGAFVCDGKGSVCPTACADDSTCVSGDYCAANGTCVARKQEGAVCNDAAGSDCLTPGCNECAAGHCVDGACCAACQGTAPLGATCTSDATCADEHCVSGVCCQSACSVPDAGSSACQAGVCDRTLGYQCRAPAGETLCRANSCTGGIQTFVATCDGAGNCGALQTENCAPYACGANECKTTCATTADCAAGAACVAATNTCVTGASCSADGTQVISNTGVSTSCSPYVCEGSGCKTACGSVTDCVTGFVCGAAGACVVQETGTPPGNTGCGCRVGSIARTNTIDLVAFGAIAVAAGARRRRRVRPSMRNVARGLGLLAIAWTILGCESRNATRTTWATANAIAARDPALSATLVSDPFVEDGRGGVVAQSWSAAPKTRKAAMSLGARLPALASGPIEVGLTTKAEAESATRGDFVLRMTHAGMGNAKLANDDGRAAYRDVAPATDLLVSARDAQVEWFYLLHDASAPAHFAIDVELPKALPRAKMRRDGSLAFLDAEGHPRLAMPRAFAVDATGQRRDVALAWDGTRGRVQLTLDTRGLTYPVLVDPTVSYPLWEEVNPGVVAPAARFAEAMAYDPVRGVVVVFGGTKDDVLNDTWLWDGTTWAQTFPQTSPAARWGASMVYDVARGKMVLFGGCSSANRYYCIDVFDDTWEWDGTTWTLLPIASPPLPRGLATMAYDSARGVSVLFGGCGNTNDNGCQSAFNDTWEWDGSKWNARTVATLPPVRQAAAMTYDVARAKTVLFGGCGVTETADCLNPVGDTWEWDGTTWTQPSVTGAPSPRGYAAMAYDSTRAETVLLGGAYGDTTVWEWNGTTWAQHSPSLAPSYRYSASMAYDSAHAEVVLFGGEESVNDTWEWNGTVWAQTSTTTLPSARQGAAIAYDTAREKAVLFGGLGTLTFNDTWEWDGTAWAERVVTTAPSARVNATMVYDSARATTLLFGGAPTNTGLNDTWEWDGTMWSQRTLTTSPSPRTQAAMVYDSARAKTVLFGGASYTTGNPADLLGDTWEWDGSTWAQRSPAMSPSPRTGASMAFDSARGKSVLFSGSNGEADTWEWDGSVWAQATVDQAPGARAFAGMAYDVVRGKTVLFGGESDTWEWDGTNWARVSTTAPSARTGEAMAYDPKRGVLLFGGTPTTSEVVNDTWLYVAVAAPCTTSATCDTGSCVDGVCCAQSQCGSCQSCALPGSEGQCTNVPAGTVPTSSSPSACALPDTCTSSGNCGAPNGSTCGESTDCVSNLCVDGVCCDTACTGDCQACSPARGLAQSGTCAFAPEGVAGRNACGNNLVCDGKGPICPTGCLDDSSCAPGYFCAANGSCAAQKQDGASCNSAAGSDCLVSGCHECQVGHCVDGACCSTCKGTAPLGASCTDDAACLSEACVGGICCQSACASRDGGGSSVCQAGFCDSTLGYQCRPASGETVCRSQSCVGGAQTFVATCSGSGDCGPLETKPCAPYVCGATECKTSCASNADCTAGATCDSTTSTCASVATCSEDGTSVVSSTGEPTSCAPYRCAKNECQTTCDSVEDCASGFLCSAAGQCAVGTSAVLTPNGGCGCLVGVVHSGALSLWALGALSVMAGRRRRRERIRRREPRRASGHSG